VKSIGDDFHDEEAQFDVCSEMFTDRCEEVAYFECVVDC
jgi:hypothetical protein